MKLKFKKDSFRNARGNHSRLLNLHCRKCENLICVYQKDGTGRLLRLYFDRIISPYTISNLKDIPITNIKNLFCNNCSEPIGVPYIYPPEKRKAFRLYQNAVIKKIIKI